MQRALLIDPDNLHLRYDLACTHIIWGELDAACDLLGPWFETRMSIGLLQWAKSDPDLDPIRDNPRFSAMLAAAESRLPQSSAPGDDLS